MQLATSNNDFLGLATTTPLEPGRVHLIIDYTGTIPDNTYNGLFSEKVDGATYVYTQFEIDGARRVFPCFDEPGYKVPWQLTLHVPKDLVALSNTPGKETPGPESGMKTVTFAQTLPLPSYLIALAVGPFDLVPAGRAGRHHTVIRIAVPHGQGDKARAAVADMGMLLGKLEDYFGMPYPYPKLDAVAIPHFFGAMENAGMITYASNILLASAAEQKTPGFLRQHRSVLAHEMAHQWFGDLVTPVWWDDLWLNESFATWLAAKVAGVPNDLWAHGVDSVDNALELDSRVTSHAIHRAIKSQADFLFVFDPITYGKGAAVISMIEHWVGDQKFRAGVRDYISKHAGKNASTSDFMAAVGQAAGDPQVVKSMTSFLDQPGVPLVSLSLTCQKGAAPTLSLSQQRLVRGTAPDGADKQLWTIPLCVNYGKGRGKPGHQCQMVSDKTATMTLKTKACPTWVNGNAGGTGYYRVSYADQMWRPLVLGQGRQDRLERARALNDTLALVESGQVSLAPIIALLPQLGRDRDLYVVNRASATAAGIAPLVPEKLEGAYAALVRKAFGARAHALGWTPRRHEPEEAHLLRPHLLPLVAVEGRDPQLVRQAQVLAHKWLKDRSTLVPDVAEPILSAAAAAGGDADLYDAMKSALDAEKDPDRRAVILSGLTSFRDPALVARTVELAAAPATPFQEMRQLLGVAGDWKAAPLAFHEAEKHFAELVSKLDPEDRSNLVRLGGGLCSTELRDQADAFFAKHLHDAPGQDHARTRMREQIDLCIAQRKAQAAAVAEALGAGH